jgi:hypothetical protein
VRITIRLILLISLSILVSACSIKVISGKTFNAKTKNRIAQLKFDNDSTCHFINTFLCNDIDPKIKQIIITCRYKRQDNLILLRNMECKSDSCNFAFTIDIPIQESKKCNFLNNESRKVLNSAGPNYLNTYEEFGFVPNIDIDTVYIVRNRLIFVKQNAYRSIGLIMK